VSAASREMREELGLSIDDWVSLGELFTTVYKRRDTVHCFQAELRWPEITIDRGEIATASWFPRHELPVELGSFVAPALARAQEPQTR
jgi:8-oxo-dGTP pyrophosphatase MutT (NUDIX family)